MLDRKGKKHMKDRISTYTLIGIPEAFVVILLIAGLILALAPWLPAGADFGVFKVPPLPYGSGLQIIGPVVFCFAFVSISHLVRRRSKISKFTV